jgi:hypothetical protein
MERLYGVGYDWRDTPIDGEVVHATGVEKAHDSETITISVLYFDVSFKYTLYLLNLEGTQCLTG